MQGVNANSQARYEASIADRNAALDRAASIDALNRGRIEEQRQYRKNAQLQGAQRAAIAANGIEVDFGSAADLQFDTAAIGWEDAATVRENAVREAKGFDISAFNQTANAASKRAQGKSAIIGAVFDAGKTILGGAQQVKKIRAGGY